MKVAFDTSVVVAASVARHPHFARADPWLSAAMEGRIEGMVALHGLAETWATLTALPISPRVDGGQARRAMRRLALYLATAAPDLTLYESALDRCVDRGLASGAVYDALHVLSAERWQADLLLTLNVGHLQRLSQPDGPRVLAPPDPPSLSV